MKRIFHICILLFSISLIFSCVSSPAAPGKDGSSVWKISRNGSTLYLAGTIHILRESDFPLPKEYEGAFLFYA